MYMYLFSEPGGVEGDIVNLEYGNIQLGLGLGLGLGLRLGDIINLEYGNILPMAI